MIRIMFEFQNRFSMTTNQNWWWSNQNGSQSISVFPFTKVNLVSSEILGDSRRETWQIVFSTKLMLLPHWTWSECLKTFQHQHIFSNLHQTRHSSYSEQPSKKKKSQKYSSITTRIKGKRPKQDMSSYPSFTLSLVNSHQLCYQYLQPQLLPRSDLVAMVILPHWAAWPLISACTNIY